MADTRVAGLLLALLFSSAAVGGELSSAAPDALAVTRFAVMPGQDEVIARSGWYQPQVELRARARPWAAVNDAAAAAQFAAAQAVARRYDSLALVVIRDGRILFEDYTAPAVSGTRFESNSMHRALFALVVGAAVADGTIPSLDTPLRALAPDWFTATDLRGGIAVRDLLYGQSGLEDPSFENRPDSPGMRLFIGSDLRGLVLGQTATTAPGTRFRGAIVDAQLLGLLLEHRLRRSYAGYLSEKIWLPIGAGPASVRLDRPGGNTRTFCCLQATARDWARVGQLVLDRGRGMDGRRVLPESWIDQMLSPAPLNAAFGMFWLLKPTPLTPRSVGASQAPPASTPFTATDAVYGGARGGQRVYVIPSRRAVIVRFGKMRYDFDDGAFLNPFIAALDAR